MNSDFSDIRSLLHGAITKECMARVLALYNKLLIHERSLYLPYITDSLSKRGVERFEVMYNPNTRTLMEIPSTELLEPSMRVLYNAAIGKIWDELVYNAAQKIKADIYASHFNGCSGINDSRFNTKLILKSIPTWMWYTGKKINPNMIETFETIIPDGRYNKVVIEYDDDGKRLPLKSDFFGLQIKLNYKSPIIRNPCSSINVAGGLSNREPVTPTTVYAVSTMFIVEEKEFIFCTPEVVVFNTEKNLKSGVFFREPSRCRVESKVISYTQEGSIRLPTETETTTVIESQDLGEATDEIDLFLSNSKLKAYTTQYGDLNQLLCSGPELFEELTTFKKTRRFRGVQTEYLY